MSPIPSSFQTLVKTPSPTPSQQQTIFSLNNKENNYDSVLNSTELKKISMPPPPPESPHTEPAPRKRRRKREDPQSCFANSEVSSTSFFCLLLKRYERASFPSFASFPIMRCHKKGFTDEFAVGSLEFLASNRLNIEGMTKRYKRPFSKIIHSFISKVSFANSKFIVA